VADARREGGRASGGWRAVIGVTIAVAFVAFVEWYLGWVELLQPWGVLPPGILAAATLLMLLSHVARGLRVHDYFGQSVRGRRAECLQLVLQHNLFNNLLPMRSGELAFPVLMNRSFAIGPSRSVPGLLWFRLLDLHTLALLVAPVLAAALPGPLLALAMLAWLAVPWLAWRAYRRFSAVIDVRIGWVSRFVDRVREGLPESERVFWRAQMWTLVTWILKLAVFVWLLQSFAPMSVPQALLGAIGGELTSVLPIHAAGGFGTYEAGIVALTLPSGLDPALLLRAAVNLHLFLLGVTLIAGGLAFLPWPRPSRVRHT
jgi:uncharacterized membrane protein YbhN (UPF0104 family)